MRRLLLFLFSVLFVASQASALTDGSAVTVTFTVWDTSTDAPKSGDNANLSISVIRDGTRAAATNASAEVDATNAPGQYKILLTAGECGSCSLITVCGKSSTANVVVVPVQFEVHALILPPTAVAIRQEIDANSTKTGYAVSATGLDLVLKSSTFGLAVADAIWEEGTRTITGGTIGTYAGNTPQTGDAFAYLGTNLGALGANATEACGTGDQFTGIASVGAVAGAVGSLTGFNVTGTTLTAIPWSAAFTTGAAGAVWNAATVTYGGAGSYGLLIETDLNATVGSRSSHSAADVVTALGTGATLTSLAPAATALSTANWTPEKAAYLTGGVALEATLTAMRGATFDTVTDSLEAIRNRGDAAWVTGAGGDPWATALPGAYAEGTAGYLLGNAYALLTNATYGLPALRTRGDIAWITASGFPAGADWTQARAIKVDRLDAAISTRATPADVKVIIGP